jgi:hypothetical protein
MLILAGILELLMMKLVIHTARSLSKEKIMKLKKLKQLFKKMFSLPFQIKINVSNNAFLFNSI